MRARDNPFRTNTVLKFRYVMPDGANFETLQQQFENLKSRAAIVAPKGHGKTTLLEDFCQHLESVGQSVSPLVLNEDNSHDAKQLCDSLLKSANKESILVIDGAEQIGRLVWRRFERRSREFQGLLITTHQPGRLPELVRCRTDLELLTAMVRELAPEQFDSFQPDLDSLFEKHAGNIRQCLWELYDRCAAEP